MHISFQQVKRLHLKILIYQKLLQIIIASLIVLIKIIEDKMLAINNNYFIIKKIAFLIKI